MFTNYLPLVQRFNKFIIGVPTGGGVKGDNNIVRQFISLYTDELVEE